LFVCIDILTMVFKVYANQGSELTKVLVTAKYAGVNVEVASGELTPDLLAKNPTGKIPTLETSEGVIFESNAIVRYIARAGGDKTHLYGKSAFESGLIDQWVDFSANTIDLAAWSWVYPIDGVISNNALATKRAGEQIKKVFQILDSHLSTRTYLVGNRVSIADIVVATSLVRLFELVLDPAFRSGFVNATRWFTTIVNQPNFLAVKGPTTLADKVAQPAKKEEKPKKEAKPKAEAKPKEEKPKKEETPKDDGEEDEEGEKEEKKKNPLDNLPKSTLVMDEWKRMYSNNDTRTVALPWFHTNYDPTGYCLFWSKYKYNGELPAQVFMVNNLVGGYFQRLEKLHKYAFGTMNLYGSGDEGWDLQGVWLFRGSEIPPDMKEVDDTEHYEWTPVNLGDPAQKAKFDDFLSWEGAVESGKKFSVGKVFK